MLIELVCSGLAWMVVAFWLASWTQNIVALILAQFYFHHEPTKKCVLGENGNDETPGVSIIKPLTGTDDLLYHNLESWFKIDYHPFEVLFCVASPDDSSIPVVCLLMHNYPHIDAKLIISGTVPQTVIFPNGTIRSLSNCCHGQRGNSLMSSSTSPIASPSDKRTSDCFCAIKNLEDVDTPNVVNPKINNMLPAYEMAKYGLIFLSDCYIEAEPDSISDAVGRLAPDVGSVCQLHFVKDPPTPDRATFGAIVNKVLFGTHNAKSVLFLNFMRCATTVSAAMLIRKAALEECGGLKAFGCYLAEDFQMGLALAKRGWKNVIGRRLAWQNPALTHVEDVFTRIVRWKKLRQTTMPILLLAEPMAECLILAATMPFALTYLGFLMEPTWSFVVSHTIAWFFVDYFLLSAINKQPLQFSKLTFLLAWLTREMAAPLLQIASLKNRRVTWRNQEFYIRLGGFTERLQQTSTSASDASSPQRNFSPISPPPLYAVKSFTSTPSENAMGTSRTCQHSSGGECCVIDFVKESPILQTPSSNKGFESFLGGKLNTLDRVSKSQNRSTPFHYWHQLRQHHRARITPLHHQQQQYRHS